MWSNIVFWRVAAFAVLILALLIAVFFYFRLGKIQKDYDRFFEDIQSEVGKIEKETTACIKTLQQTIGDLIDLLLILDSLNKTQDLSLKLGFQATLEKLPEDIRKLIKIEV